MIHELKIEPKWLDAVLAGTKRFELRKNDRDFHAGDYLHLREWHPEAAPGGEGYGKRECIVRVTFMLYSEMLAPGYVALSISDPI